MKTITCTSTLWFGHKRHQWRCWAN